MDWFNLNVDDTADDNDDGDRQYNRYVSVSTTFISGETKRNQNQHGVKDKYYYTHTKDVYHICRNMILFGRHLDPTLKT